MHEAVRRDVLIRLAWARRSMESRLLAFSADTAAKVGVTPEWSARDLLVHLVAWLEEFLRHADDLSSPNPQPLQYDDDAFNETVVRERASQAWDELVRAYGAAMDGIRRHVERVPLEHLELGRRYRDWVESDAIQHMYQHGGQLTAWLKKLGLKPVLMP
jgi:uncharacterized damage-inducible protein DinB